MSNQGTSISVNQFISNALNGTNVSAFNGGNLNLQLPASGFVIVVNNVIGDFYVNEADAFSAAISSIVPAAGNKVFIYPVTITLNSTVAANGSPVFQAQT